MKRIDFSFAVGFLLVLVLVGCVEEDPAFIAPEAAFSVNKNEVEVFELLTLTNEGEGQFYAVFTGDAGHQFARRDSGDTGFKTDADGNFSYSYAEAGTYTLTFVASGYRFQTGEQVESISETTITVTDPDISAIRLVGFEVANSVLNNNKFLDPVTFLFKDYRKTADTIDQENLKIGISYYRPNLMGEIKGGAYNPFQVPADINIIPDIKLNVPSRTIKVQIEGIQTFTNGQTRIPHETEDNLRFQEKAYQITNQQGQTKTYTVCPMIIPAFLDFEIGGKSTVVSLSPRDYREFFIQADLPDTTNLTQLQPTWTLYDPDHTEVFVSEAKQVSGISTQDFTDPVTYTLVYTQPKGPEDTYTGTFSVRAQIIVSID